LEGDLVSILSDSERKDAGEVERPFDILLVDFQVVAGENSELSLGEVGPWDREHDLAAWDGDVRVALNSLAWHRDGGRITMIVGVVMNLKELGDYGDYDRKEENEGSEVRRYVEEEETYET
jgi:hypothetical protein